MVFFEQGYILKTSPIVTILNPSDEGVANQDGSFATLDLSGTIPPEGRLVGARWNWANNVPNAVSFIRGIGSSDNTQLVVQRNQTSATQMARLNSDREIEYRRDISGGTDTVELAVLWYQERQNQFVLNTGVGVGKTANAVIG